MAVSLYSPRHPRKAMNKCQDILFLCCVYFSAVYISPSHSCFVSSTLHLEVPIPLNSVCITTSVSAKSGSSDYPLCSPSTAPCPAHYDSLHTQQPPQRVGNLSIAQGRTNAFADQKTPHTLVLSKSNA